MPSKKNRNRKKGNQKTTDTKTRAKAVDLVTGKAKVEYFFDPSKVLDEKNSNSTSFKSPNKKNVDIDLFSSKHLFVPCTIIKSLDEDSNQNGDIREGSGPVLVKTSDGTLYKVREAKELATLTAPDDYVGMSDVLHLANISEASLLHTLRTRYKRDDIYTSAGPILISVNPYKQISKDGQSLYSHDTMMKYREADSFSDTQEPHLFQIADKAYSAMMDSVHNVPHVEDDDAGLVVEGDIGISPGQARNQSIIISGESGAGKTEATKFIMQYLARITRKKRQTSQDTSVSPDGKASVGLEERVLSSNPLLESFGNAQTLRNDNSSRFGKFIHINFSVETGSIVGARISNYLLEKTRITQQIDGERNYHIFYQLFAGADPDLLAELGMDAGAASFKYLGSRQSPKTTKDVQNYAETVKCLDRIGLSKEQQKTIFSLAAAVLHLGNVTFDESDKGDHSACVSESTRPSLQKACALLGLNEEDVTEAILTKLLTIGGKTIKKPSTIAMAEDKRDALAKMTYSCIFLWLVESINQTLRQSSSSNDVVDDEKVGFIGVLDIYGFETFEINGYEQLLINYCNEKLQRHFNRHLFEVEQQLYSAEGVDWTYITFNDNRPCLELIEGGGGKGGILSTLDDSYAGMGDASEKDVKFVGQLHKLFGRVAGAKDTSTGHEYFITPKFGNDRQFVILHYAGEVKYTADGFVEKNMESLSNELKELGDSSTVELARAVFAHASSNVDASQQSGSRRSSIRGFSVASQFKLSLQALVEDLDRTQPHYIRCIKPNLKKSPSIFAAGEVLKQLRYSGMMEAIRIRREGYALREPHQLFYNRFSVLLAPEDFKDDDDDMGIEQLVKALSKRLNVTDADWQIGHSKIFLRRELSDKLERLAKLRVHAAARTLGKFGKEVVERRLSRLIVNWTRFRLIMLKKYRAHRAASKIQSVVRMNRVSKAFAVDRRSIILVQSLQRRISAVHRVRKMRDPYCDMTYKDMKGRLKSEKQKMAEAVNAQDFKEAADIEARMEVISAVMESKKPMTRKRLEEKISDMQVALEDALKRKAYADAGPLQDDLEALLEQRKIYPTINELKEAVLMAERGVSTAAKNRDFAAAAASQTDLDIARKNLAMVLEAEEESDDETAEEGAIVAAASNLSIEGFECRADLEEEIASMHKQVEDAIAKKDFKRASELQAKIENREQLRSFFPSLEELEADLLQAEAAQEKAIAKKDFNSAGKLNEEIDRITRQIKSEKEKNGTENNGKAHGELLIKMLDGEEKVFESRFSLEEEIKKTKKLQSDSISKKEFKQAESYQVLIDQMEELRTKLPTVAELGKLIREKKKQMQEAISLKKFGDAEKLDGEIERLEKMLSAEKENAQSNEIVPLALHGSDLPVPSPTIGNPQLTTNIGTTPSSKVMVRNDDPTESPKLGKPPSPKEGLKSMSMSVSKSSSMDGISVGSATPLANHPGPVGSSKLTKKTVMKLRPKKPILLELGASVFEVSQMLANRRNDAAIVQNDDGSLAGIITDTDITRRIVAKGLDPKETLVDHVMTSNPTCASTGDAAMDAMTIMVENHFRHLPIQDESGGIVGLLDIQKCLNDAIDKLQRSAQEAPSGASEVVLAAMKHQGASGSQAAALQALLQPVLQQAFGGKVAPTLRSLINEDPPTIVSPTTNVLDAGKVMAECRKAAMIVDNGQLVGVFGFKDMMTRVVAKELPLESTEVSAVMTPNPESVLPDMTVLDALQSMHDNKFLTLPVCEEDGTVVGLVDVMDVIYGCGGVDGWKSVFTNVLDMEDLSDTGSIQSGMASRVRSIDRNVGRPAVGTRPVKGNADARNVAMLRPKKPLIAHAEDSIFSVAQFLANHRGDAAILVNSSGQLAGIVTDTDFTRRVVSQHVSSEQHAISNVMTPNPKFVATTDSALDALVLMIEHRFRHLPVSDGSGAIVGILDIAKCLNDAISKLERSSSKRSGAAETLVKQALEQSGKDGSALEALIGPLVSQAFGNDANRTLRSILSGSPSTIVSPDSSVFEAASVMTTSRKAALVVENDKLVGIFGFKDMMSRVIAEGLDIDATSVEEVMTPQPETVPPEMTILEALQTMHDNRFLTLPVCEADGGVVGLVDVMDVINACGGVDGWRAVFDSALDLDDDMSAYFSAAQSTSRLTKAKSGGTVVRSVSTPQRDPVITVSRDTRLMSAPKMPGNIPTTLEFEHGAGFDEGGISLNDTFHSDFHTITFKIVDMSGHTHRIRSDGKMSSLHKVFTDKVKVNSKKKLRFKFVDDEGDPIMITTDDDLLEAVRISRASLHTTKAGPLVVKLTAVEIEEAAGMNPSFVAGIGIALALAGIGAMVALRPRRG